MVCILHLRAQTGLELSCPVIARRADWVNGGDGLTDGLSTDDSNNVSFALRDGIIDCANETYILSPWDRYQTSALYLKLIVT